MRCAIDPNYLRDAINEKLDKAISECPSAESERENLFNQLLEIFDETGNIPDFTLTKKETE